MNFDSQTVKLAMEQMKNMSPEQIKQMMSCLPPSAMSPEMRAASNQMQGMSNEDWERACNQFKSADPNTVAKQAAEAQSRMSAYGDYVLQASNQLKTEGNEFHKTGEYKKALEKYTKALENVKDNNSEAAKSIKKACSLNVSSCYLKLEEYDKCVSECTSVIAEYGADLKAYYRRGQAYAGQRRWRRADKDLSRALKLCSADSSERGAIREKLQEVKDQRSLSRASGVAESDSEPEPELAPKPAPSSSFKIEEIIETSTPSSSSPSSSSSAPAEAANGGAAGIVGAKDAKEAFDFFKKNPEKAGEMADMLSAMPPEQLQQMMRAAGAPEGFNASPEMIKFAMEAMKNLSPEDVDRLSRSMPARGANVASSSSAGAGGSGSNSSASPPLGGMGGSMGGMGGDMDAMLKDPNMLKSATAMMRNMDEKTLAGLMSSTGMCKPEQAEMMAAKVKGLSENQINTLLSAASWIQSAMKAARDFKRWVRKNWILVIAIVLVIVGIWLRR